jgi:hypothetical protein
MELTHFITKLVPPSLILLKFLTDLFLKNSFRLVLDICLVSTLYIIFKYTELSYYSFYILQILKIYNVDIKYYYNYSNYITGLNLFFDTQIEFILSLFNYRGSDKFSTTLFNFFIAYILPLSFIHV